MLLSREGRSVAWKRYGSDKPQQSAAADRGESLAVVAAAAIPALVGALAAPRLLLPVVVLEIMLGIVIGPDVLGLAEPDDFLDSFSSLGLGMLFFFAGYEIDFERIRGSPLRLAAFGWLLSLALAYGLGGLLALSGVVLSLVFTGSAMATTAIGTLILIVRDAGDLRTRVMLARAAREGGRGAEAPRPGVGASGLADRAEQIPRRDAIAAVLGSRDLDVADAPEGAHLAVDGIRPE